MREAVVDHLPLAGGAAETAARAAADPAEAGAERGAAAGVAAEGPGDRSERAAEQCPADAAGRRLAGRADLLGIVPALGEVLLIARRIDPLHVDDRLIGLRAAREESGGEKS